MENVIMYSTPTCPQCKFLETLFQRKGISYTKEMDVDKMLALGISSVPMVKADGYDHLLNFTEVMKIIK